MGSVLAAILGILGTGVAMRRLSGGRPELYWLVGLLALLPAWLLEFVALLGIASASGSEGRRAFLLPSALGLLGVILSDALARRLRAAGQSRSRWVYWALGAAALTPGWAVTLMVRTWIRP